MQIVVAAAIVNISNKIAAIQSSLPVVMIICLTAVVPVAAARVKRAVEEIIVLSTITGFAKLRTLNSLSPLSTKV